MTEIEYDDGAKTLYVRGTLKYAVGQALRAAGASEPAIGGKLSVTYTGDGAPSRPGLRGAKQYSAVYEPPTASTGAFFGGNSGGGDLKATVLAAAQKVSGGKDQPPAGIDPQAWAEMSPEVRQAISSSKPPF